MQTKKASVQKTVPMCIILFFLTLVGGCFMNSSPVDIEKLNQVAIKGELTVSFIDSLIVKHGESDYLCGMKTVLLCDEDVKEAQLYFDNITVKPSTYIVYSYGYILHANQEFESAMAVYESSILNDEQNQNFWVHIGLAYIKEAIGQSYDSVMESVSKAKKISSPNLLITASEAELNVLLGEYELADRLVQEIPENYRPSWIYFIKGQSKLKQEDYLNAEVYFKKGISLAKNNQEALDLKLSMVDVHIYQKKIEEAANIINELIIEYPDNLSVLYRTAEIEDQKKNYTEAIKLFEKAFEKEVLPNFFNAYIQICLDYLSPGETLTKYNKYKNHINKIDFQNFGFYVDAAEILIYDKMKNHRMVGILNKKYDSKYSEEEVDYKNKLLTR